MKPRPEMVKMSDKSFFTKGGIYCVTKPKPFDKAWMKLPNKIGKMKPRPKIKCRKCNGKGKVELDPVLFGTWHILGELKKCTALQMFECLQGQQNLSIGLTAINKRLERLRKCGMAKRTKNGKEWHYEQCKTKES